MKICGYLFWVGKKIPRAHAFIHFLSHTQSTLGAMELSVSTVSIYSGIIKVAQFIHFSFIENIAAVIYFEKERKKAPSFPKVSVISLTQSNSILSFLISESLELASLTCKEVLCYKVFADHFHLRKKFVFLALRATPRTRRMPNETTWQHFEA